MGFARVREPMGLSDISISLRTELPHHGEGSLVTMKFKLLTHPASCSVPCVH
jgi:hypothetical protein